jgi:hypothetical protein
MFVDIVGRNTTRGLSAVALAIAGSLKELMANKSS